VSWVGLGVGGWVGFFLLGVACTWVGWVQERTGSFTVRLSVCSRKDRVLLAIYVLR
jgi:hypothetical protein